MLCSILYATVTPFVTALLKNQLSATDLEFFGNQSNWKSGPMYEVWLYGTKNTTPEQMESAIFEAGNLTIWEGVERPRMLKSIMAIKRLPPVGLVHSSHRGWKCSYFPSYSLAIYPEHYIRALGMPIQGRGKDCESEQWHEMNPDKVSLFHEAIFSLINEVSNRTRLVSSSINTEDRGMMQPYVADGSICLSPNVADVLGLKSIPIPYSYGYFVSISHARRNADGHEG